MNTSVECMKPPICIICYKEFRDSDEGGLVYFEKSKSDERWIKAMKVEGLTGHPPYADWFCDKHYAAAKELSHLTIPEAIEILKEKFTEE